MIQNYSYFIEDVCAGCGETAPIAPVWFDPQCYPCRGFVLLDCGRHIIESMATEYDGMHLPVTSCELCDGEGDGSTSNHAHSSEELAALEAEVEKILDAT